MLYGIELDDDWYYSGSPGNPNRTLRIRGNHRAVAQRLSVLLGQGLTMHPLVELLIWRESVLCFVFPLPLRAGDPG